MDEASRRELSKQIRKRTDPYLKRFAKNIFRAQGLLTLYGSQELTTVDSDTRDDVLRSAVVFMHATLEQFLRQLASSFLPLADEQTLNDIPLIGITGRAEKFLLGKLRTHRDRSVRAVIEQSVNAHLEKSTFNNIGDITRLLVTIGIDTKEVEPHFAPLSRMIARRHEIVHRADNRDDVDASTPVDPAEVKEWISALHYFSAKILSAAAVKHLIDEGHL